MKWYEVTIRGHYEQSVYIEAPSKRDAKRMLVARSRAGYAPGVELGEPQMTDWWVAQSPAEELDYDPSDTGSSFFQ